MGVILLACLLVQQCVSRLYIAREMLEPVREPAIRTVEAPAGRDRHTGPHSTVLRDPISDPAVRSRPAISATAPVPSIAQPASASNALAAAELETRVPRLSASARKTSGDAPPFESAGYRRSVETQENVVADDGMIELDTALVPGTPAPYVDSYLTDDDADPGSGFGGVRGARMGRRFVEAELIYYDSTDDFFGSATEKGLRTRWRQETLNWGEIDGELIVSDIESDFLGRQYQNDEVYFTLRQTNAPLENGWLMSNTAGHQRTLTDPFLHSGYRIRLPTSLFLGASMGVATDTSASQWYFGKTGDNLGIAVPQFHENGGEILGGSWRGPLTQSVMFGAEVVNVKGQERIRDHTSLLAAGSYTQPDGLGQYDLHMLTDDDANLGVWADNRNVLWADVVLRSGAFYLEPDLVWMDKPIVSDQYGAYVRADKRSYLYNYSIGYDYTRSGLDSNSLFDARYQSLFINGNYRLSRKLSIGANANILLRDFQTTTQDEQTAWRLSNFVNYRFETGLGRLELYASQLNSIFELNNNDLYGARFSYDWNMPQGYRLTTEALLEEQRRLHFDNSRQRLSVLFRQSIASNLSWGMNTSYFRDAGQALNSATGIGINADARWQFLPDWYVSASLVHNESSIDPSAANFIGGDTELESNSVWLRIGYANVSGQPFQRFGRSTSGAGAGRVSGEVFYDENRDFIRQPDERPAVGVVVMIDGRYETRTDSRGRYEFDPVYPGPHRVSLVTADLPLPWGLDDETPQRIDVRVRQPTDMNFPLVKLTGF